MDQVKLDDLNNKSPKTSTESKNNEEEVSYKIQTNSPSTSATGLRRIFKIIVIGDSNVGKTCLTYRFTVSKFLGRSEATIGVDFREKQVEIDGEVIKLQIWDTGVLINLSFSICFELNLKKIVSIAGQERFRKSMISHYYRNVHAVVFVYDVTNLTSFENLSYWIDEYNRNCGQQPNSFKHVPRILVGNKCDLTAEIRVNTSMAQTFADMHQMPLFETSAKDDSKLDHVEAIFMTIALKLKNSKPFYTPNELHRAPVQSVLANGELNGSQQQQDSGCSC